MTRPVFLFPSPTLYEMETLAASSMWVVFVEVIVCGLWVVQPAAVWLSVTVRSAFKNRLTSPLYARHDWLSEWCLRLCRRTLEQHQRAAKVHEQWTKCWTGQKFIVSLQWKEKKKLNWVLLFPSKVSNCIKSLFSTNPSCSPPAFTSFLSHHMSKATFFSPLTSPKKYISLYISYATSIKLCLGLFQCLCAPCPNTPDSNEPVVIRLQQSLMTSWSFKSGVLEQGNIYNMQRR